LQIQNGKPFGEVGRADRAATETTKKTLNEGQKRESIYRQRSLIPRGVKMPRIPRSIVTSKVIPSGVVIPLRSHSRTNRTRSKSVDDAKWRLFNQAIEQVRKSLSNRVTEQLDTIIDNAVTSVRKKKRRKLKGPTE
jgi:hypothetical protein